MARINVPPLDLPTVVDNLCKFVTAGKMDAAACAKQVAAEIDRQMTIFVKTHVAVKNELELIHRTTQSLFRASEAETKELFAKKDPSVDEYLELIRKLETDLKNARTEFEAFKEQKVAMVAQQPCRGGLCAKESEKALGAEFAGLNAKYINYRKGPLTDFIKSVAAQDRVAEHLTRIEDMIKRAKVAGGQVQTTAKKSFEESFNKNKAVLDQTETDIKSALERSKGYDDSIKRYTEQIKKKTISQAECLSYVKTTKISYDKFTTDFKAYRTKIKTCRLRLDDMKDLADRMPTLISDYKKALVEIEDAEKYLANAIKTLDGYKVALVTFNTKAKAMK